MNGDGNLSDPRNELGGKPTGRVLISAQRVDRMLTNRGSWHGAGEHWNIGAVVRPDAYPDSQIGPTIEAAALANKAGVEVSLGVIHLGQRGYEDWRSRVFWERAARVVRIINEVRRHLGWLVPSLIFDIEPYLYPMWGDRRRKYPLLENLYAEGPAIRWAMEPFLDEVAEFEEVVIEQAHPTHLIPALMRLALPPSVAVVAASNNVKMAPYCKTGEDAAIQARVDANTWSEWGVESYPVLYMRGLVDSDWRADFERKWRGPFYGFFAGSHAFPEYTGKRTRENVYEYGTSGYLEGLVPNDPEHPRCSA